MGPETLYQAYVIRLWPTSRQGRTDCRVTLEDIATRSRIDFADLDSLFGYLRSQADLFGARQVMAADAKVLRERNQE